MVVVKARFLRSARIKSVLCSRLVVRTISDKRSNRIFPPVFARRAASLFGFVGGAFQGEQEETSEGGAREGSRIAEERCESEARKIRSHQVNVCIIFVSRLAREEAQNDCIQTNISSHRVDS